MPLKIYYLDDETELLDIFLDAFSMEGIEISIFSVPELAIKAMKSCPPDLLFIDYRLPNTNGDVIALELDPNIPKVLITGELQPSYKANYRAIFTKPYRLSEVREFIQQIKTSFLGK